MTIRNLDKLLSPKSIAVFGASDREGSVGKTICDNLLANPYQGGIWFVNPKHKTVKARTSYREAKQLPGIPDLAVIATPAVHVPKIITDLGGIGCKAAVVISAGIREDQLTQKMLNAAKKHCLRIIGPNCIGMMLPRIHVNASFAHLSPLSGEIAFISQSGAVISSVIDWAAGNQIGFSTVVSMGDMADVDMGDMLDYLASDPHTRAIVMYIEHITHARKFISAARSAARVKPIVVIKSGKHQEAAHAAFSHTGALAGSDASYDAAFHRAGILRVSDLEELFVAVEILNRIKYVGGDRLAILTNGGGAGVLAVDCLIEQGGSLAALSDATIKQLSKILPDKWSKSNPIDIIGDAAPERYQRAIEIVLQDPNVDALLVMNCPTALASSIDAAKATIHAIKAYNNLQSHPKIILTAWLGQQAAKKARRLFSKNALPAYQTPTEAIRGFTYLTRHAKDIRALMQTPPNMPTGFKTYPDSAREILLSARKDKRNLLNEIEAKSIIKYYDIPTVETYLAKTPLEVKELAAKILRKDDRVVLKILSKQISHKSDVGGVVLGLSSPEAAEHAATEMLSRIKKQQKNVTIEGFAVQPMIQRTNAYELIIGVTEDQTFGPVILFGAGGTAVEVLKDTATALPPLDLKLAHDLIQQTKIATLLRGYRDRAAVNMDALALTLVKVSQMITDLPEITELDINPLIVNEQGVIALDARIKINDQMFQSGTINPRFAIRPYPKQWERVFTLRQGRNISIRPIKPEDERFYDLFLKKCSPEDIRMRLFSPIKHLSHEFIARLTQIDYARSMAFIALNSQKDEMLGVSRIACDPDYTRAEYAVMVRTDLKGYGIGWALMQQLIDYAVSEGIQEIWGNVLKENNSMIKMCKTLNFKIKSDADDPALCYVSLDLTKQR